jgi:hypothetical protein
VERGRPRNRYLDQLAAGVWDVDAAGVDMSS